MDQRNYRIAMALISLAMILAFVQFDYSELIASDTDEASNKEDWRSELNSSETEKATFAGGCFWCIEAAYMDVEGVDSAVSGYIGGKESTATYEQVASGQTEHREAVEVEYYSSIVSYEELLEIYWRSIDPTDQGGQFSDRGYQYTTAIYAHNQTQYEVAVESKINLSESGKFDEPIVTEIKNHTSFYRAEDYHQNYSKKNTVRYKAYERASGRKSFIQEAWDQNPLS